MRYRNISIIIISPLLGHKNGNKTFFIKDEIEKKIEVLNKEFFKPDIVLVTGNQYLKRLPYRVIQNQLYFDTGEVEQVRLGLNATVNQKVLIIKDDSELEIEKIKHGIKKGVEFITTCDNPLNVGINTDNKKLIQLSYGLKPKFSNIFFVHNRLGEVENFVIRKHNSNKKIHEIIQHLIDIEPICVY